ncbi:hypothetical protein F0562_019463 [Nyssa sinensis]|uniref:Uncharacterized protein n=1 Tax=Nyssa sinensis TaxID=561372 RepID=A0A5J5BRK2_9ASTE|nr:hypothetical protein F0562_019463 [Nyssa sinensis]
MLWLLRLIMEHFLKSPHSCLNVHVLAAILLQILEVEVDSTMADLMVAMKGVLEEGDGAANVAQGTVDLFSSSNLSDEKDSDVYYHHDLSDLLLDSSLDDIIERDDGVAMGEASTHNTYSAHSWADHVEEGEYIPQAAMDLEAEYGGFLEDPSFLIESLPDVSSSPNLRGRRSFNNGGHGGRDGRERGTWVVRGNQDQILFFQRF